MKENLWIERLVNDYAVRRREMLDLYGRYLANESDVPIFNRVVPNYNKVNNKVNNDFFSEVIDTKVGYMLGVPIVYSINSDQKDKETAEVFIRRFNKRVNIHDYNSENEKLTSICGTSGRLLFINEEGDVDVMVIPPWQLIYKYDAAGKNLKEVIRYYYVELDDEEKLEDELNSILTLREGRTTTEDDSSGTASDPYTPQIITRTDVDAFSHVSGYKRVVDVYTAKTRKSYILDPQGGELRIAVEKPHGFTEIPIIEYKNNEERQGDCDKIIELIDSYDRVFSDYDSELEQFRLAYLALYGLELHSNDADPNDPESPDGENTGASAIDVMKQTGAFEMTADGKIEFITKDIKDEPVNKLLDRIERNITRFSRSVDFSDENFYGNISGVAIKYRLSKLENKVKMAERKFDIADTQMWKIVTKFWMFKNMADIDYLNIEKHFTRNVPVDLLEEARVQKELYGTVSQETRLSQATFIDDAKLEMNRITRELEDDEAEYQGHFKKLLNDGTLESNSGNTNPDADESLREQEDRHDDLRPDDRKLN